jgi:hypothetical protein
MGEIRDFYENRLRTNQANWFEFGKMVVEALDQGVDVAVTEGIGETIVQKLTTAYRFLEVRGITGPIKGSYYTIACLPNIYSKMSGADKDEKFEELVKEAVEGVWGSRRMRRLSVTLSNSVTKETSQKINTALSNMSEDLREGASEGAIIALRGTLDTLEYVLKKALSEVGYEKLTAELAGRCDTMATELRCVADPEYRKMWEERKEGVL